MPLDLLTLSAAFLTGVMGSVHCVVMCGGIATSLSAASAPTIGHRHALAPAVGLNAARVLGYVLAGAIVGGLGSGLQRVVDVLAWQTALRVALGVAIMLIALRLVGIGDRWNMLGGVGQRFWRLLAPLQRKLLPARTWPRRIALGMLWGWLPCGLSGSLLMVAWLEADALHGALVMAAFGFGTLPTMTVLTWSGARSLSMLSASNTRYAIAALVFASGLLTATAPWLMHMPALHGALEALGCRSLVP